MFFDPLRPSSRLRTVFLVFSHLAILAAVAGCNSNATISGIHFTASSGTSLKGTITVGTKTYKLSAGENTTDIEFSPVTVNHVSVTLDFTNSKNKDPIAGARTAIITTQIGLVQDLKHGILGMASGGKVTITGNDNDFPNLVSNCDRLFKVSSDGPVLNLRFSGLTTLAQCTPAKKVNLYMYDPRLIGNRDPSEGKAIYTEAQDEERGKEFVDEYLKENEYLVHDRNDTISQYVQNIAERVVAASDRPDEHVTAYVIDMDDINAFAVPGGYIFVNTGLLKAATHESELVGVLGHEWAHVTCRHASRYRSIFRILMGQDYKTQRVFENEADAVGTQYAWNAGYEPWGLNGMFRMILEADPTSDNPKAVKRSDHPATYRRIDRVTTYAQLFYPPKSSYIHDSLEFEAIHSELNTAAAEEAVPPVDMVYYKKHVLENFERHFIDR